MPDRPTFAGAVGALGGSSMDLLDAVFEQAPFGVYVDDPSRGCVYANPALLDQFGLDWKDFQGFGWARFIVPEDADRMQAAIREYELTREPIRVTYRVRVDDGPTRWVHARVRAVIDAGGRHVGSVGVTLDATEEREFKKRAARSQKLEAVGTLSARLAHDLNNLLTVIVTSTDLLEYEIGPEAGRESIEAMRLAFDQAQRLTDQLLTLSRRRVSSQGVSEFDGELSRLERLLRGTLGESIQLDIRLDAPGIHVPLDRGAIGQIVINLVSNARDAMDGRGRLAISTSATDGEVLCVVEDGGSGIDEDLLDRIFEPFFTTKAEGRGSGLGLTTVRDLVVVAGGDLRVESRMGHGTRVLLTLPRVGPAVYPTRKPRSPLTTGAEGAVVLVVEDNEALRQALGYGLALGGYTVHAAGSLTEALERFSEVGDIDAVVSDIMLPDGQGNDLVRQLRARSPELPVVFTSGFAGSAVEELGSLDHHTAFVPKPFQLNDVLMALERVTARP